MRTTLAEVEANVVPAGPQVLCQVDSVVPRQWTIWGDAENLDTLLEVPTSSHWLKVVYQIGNVRRVEYWDARGLCRPIVASAITVTAEYRKIAWTDSTGAPRSSNDSVSAWLEAGCHVQGRGTKTWYLDTAIGAAASGTVPRGWVPPQAHRLNVLFDQVSGAPDWFNPPVSVISMNAGSMGLRSVYPVDSATYAGGIAVPNGTDNVTWAYGGAWAGSADWTAFQFEVTF